MTEEKKEVLYKKLGFINDVEFNLYSQDLLQKELVKGREFAWLANLDDIQKKDGQFGNVGDNIREAFAAGVQQVEEYSALINKNIIYYIAAVLDP